MSKHKLASAADFRNRIKDEDCYEAPEYVTLPTCGLEVRLRRPRPLAYTLLGAPLPGLPEGYSDDDSKSEGQTWMSTKEKVQVAKWMGNLWSNVFVHPKLSMAPGAEEIHPDWIPDADQQFIWKWIREGGNHSGESLSAFPEKV